MNEIHYAYFTEDEIEYILQCVEDVIQIYSVLDWDEPPTPEELETHICDSILEMRADETLNYILRWRVKIEKDIFSDFTEEISILL
jgi:hypothetical protein